MIYVAMIVWFAVFGVLCAVIAPGRGRKAITWFFIGAIFGVFGLIALVAIPKLVTVGVPTDKRVCPRCAETIKKAAVVCRFCGHEFSHEKSTPETIKNDLATALQVTEPITRAFALAEVAKAQVAAGSQEQAQETYVQLISAINTITSSLDRSMVIDEITQDLDGCNLSALS